MDDFDKIIQEGLDANGRSTKTLRWWFEQGRIAEREVCVTTCIDEANKQWAAFEASPDDYVEGRADSADYLAQKMRSNIKVIGASNV